MLLKPYHYGEVMKKISKIIMLSITCAGALQTFCMDRQSELASITQEATKGYNIKIIQRILNSNDIPRDAESIQIILAWAFWRIAKLTKGQGTFTLESQFKSTYVAIANSCLQWIYQEKQFDITTYNQSTKMNGHYIYINHDQCPNKWGESCQLCKLTARLKGQIKLTKQKKTQ